MDFRNAYPHNGILFINKKKQSTDICYNMKNLNDAMINERIQTKRTEHYMSRFVRNFKKKQIYRDKVNQWYLGLRVRVETYWKGTKG